MRRLFFIIFYLSWTFAAFAQKGSIIGKVSDSKNSPLIGANILVKGTSLGTASNSKGIFKISNLNFGAYELKFSMLGYKGKSINVELNKEVIEVNISLEESHIVSEQVVITASKYQKQISDLSVSASVLGYEEINKKGFTSVEQALRYAPGVNITLDQISVRGSSGYSRGAGTRVLMALDGAPISTGDTGEIIYEMIPIQIIDKVEIIKGAASSLYGSSAIGGVINIISKEISSNPLYYLSAQYGAYDKPYYNEWKWSNEIRAFNSLTFSYSNRFNNFGTALTLNRDEDMGYKKNGAVLRYNGSIKTDYNLNEFSKLQFFANVLFQKRGNFIYWKNAKNALEPPDSDLGQNVISNRSIFAASYNNAATKNLLLKIKGSYYRTRWEDESISRNNSTANQYRLELQTNLFINNRFSNTSGIEAYYGRSNSNIFGDHYSLGIALYNQLDYSFEFPLTLTAGLRYDYNKLDVINSFNSFSPKFGLNYKLDNLSNVRASFGTGFRAPTLAEAFTTTSVSGVTVKPNPNLKPENNYTFEVGANRLLFNAINIDLALFHSEYFDFIEPQIDNSDGKVFFENITRARIQGLEANLKFYIIPSALSLDNSYTYLWARDIKENKALRYRPRHLVYEKLDLYISNINIGADFRYWKKVEEIDQALIDLGVVPDGDKRVDVFVLDFRAGISLFNYAFPLKIFFNIENVLNYNYVEIIGNLAPIRNYSLKIEAIF